MNQIFREFLHWSIGFAVVSTTAILVVHLFARKRRRAEAASNNAAGTSQPSVRRPIWGASLLVLVAYLLLLGPVLQGIGRAFQTKSEQSQSVAPSMQSSVFFLMGKQRLFTGGASGLS